MDQRRQEATISLLQKSPTRAINAKVAAADLPNFREAVKKILPAVVSIDVVGVQQGFFGMVEQVGDSGSGVIISDEGHIVTNAHVVNAGQRTESIVVHLADGRSMGATLIGADPVSDLAVLKVDGKPIQPATLGTSSDLEVGDWVLALGNPFNQSNTVSAGIVGNLGRDVQVARETWLFDTIQTDAAINPGNSGGALANAEGELVGINSAIYSPTRTSSGLGFSIPIDRARPIIAELIKSGFVKYGYLGIKVTPQRAFLKNPRVRAAYAQDFGVEPPADGLLVTDIGPGSPAERSGIQKFDVLLEARGEMIRSKEDWDKVTYGIRPGEKIKVKYFSRGKEQTVELSATELAKL